jgi:hypothetical protein
VESPAGFLSDFVLEDGRMRVVGRGTENHGWKPYPDFFLQLSFKARPDNLSLAGLETVCNRQDGADVVGH